MSKYKPLIDFLKNIKNDNYKFSFVDIEKIIGQKLPNSAYRHDAWWANDLTHVQMKDMIQSGWKISNIDLKNRQVEFTRITPFTQDSISNIVKKRALYVTNNFPEMLKEFQEIVKSKGRAYYGIGNWHPADISNSEYPLLMYVQSKGNVVAVFKISRILNFEEFNKIPNKMSYRVTQRSDFQDSESSSFLELMETNILHNPFPIETLESLHFKKKINYYPQRVGYVTDIGIPKIGNAGTYLVMSFDDLLQYLQEEMEMQENYQPVVIKTLVENGGRSSKELIRKVLEEYNQPNPTKSMFYTVLDVLKRRNIIHDENNKLILNINGQLSDEESKKIIDLCNQKIAEANGSKENLEYYIALGPWSNWDHTIKHPPLRWGVRDSSASNIGVYDALKEGDIVFYYANQDLPTPFSKRGLFGVGRVTRKYIENEEKYWPDEQISNKVIYKHRFEIENLKLVKTDEELLPWIDGLPFTKGLNHIVDQIPLEKLLEHARTKWKLDLPTLPQTNSVNYWKISPGEQAKYWQDDLDRGIIAIGWSRLGDLSGITPEELNKRMREQYYEEVAQRYQIENFLKIKKGDIIIANRGKSTVVGIGRVVGDYKYYSALEQPHTYKVEWFDTQERQIPTQNNWFVTVLPVSSDFYEQILSGNFIEETYLLLRYKDSDDHKWRDEIGKKYHFGKIANYTKLTKNSKAVWFDKKDGKYYFWGHGNVDDIVPDASEDSYAIFNKFEFFTPPKESTDSVRDKIERSPGYNIQSSILEISKDLYDEIVGNRIPFVSSDDPLPIPTREELKEGFKKISEELLVSEEKITEIVTALASGRHVLLAGPIGTGKTELARKIPTIFWEKYGGYYSEDHTATADWNTQDVIGGIFPKMNKEGQPIYEIQNGCVVDTVQKNWLNGVNGGPRNHSQSPSKIPPYRGTWLIIDEFNRADIDKAFGQLFTALRTHTLKIPTDVEKTSYKTLKIPQDYRIIGTLNTADKHYLFQLSDALKSRFAYIEIDIPNKEQVKQEIYYAMKNALSDLITNHYDDLIVVDNQVKEIDQLRSNPEFYSRIYQAYHFLDTVRIFKRLGTAILKLVYQNLLVGTKMTGNSKVALDNALTSNLIPQLENLSQAEIGAIHALYSDNIVKYFQDAYKNPNRQSYVNALTSVLEYLKVSNTTLVAQFANGNLNVEDAGIWHPLQTAYDVKKQEFELQLDQLKQSMEDLIETMVI